MKKLILICLFAVSTLSVVAADANYPSMKKRYRTVCPTVECGCTNLLKPTSVGSSGGGVMPEPWQDISAWFKCPKCKQAYVKTVRIKPQPVDQSMVEVPEPSPLMKRHAPYKKLLSPKAKGN